MLKETQSILHSSDECCFKSRQRTVILYRQIKSELHGSPHMNNFTEIELQYSYVFLSYLSAGSWSFFVCNEHKIAPEEIFFHEIFHYKL
jgi:hypothetical protein